MTDHLRVATWNMHRGVGVDGRFSPQRIARVIAELDADLIALQEFGSRRAGFDMRAHLEQTTGWPTTVMATCADRHGEFGNAVLTRLAVLSATCVALSMPGREPRNAVDILLRDKRFRLRVIATHLGLHAPERHAQIAQLDASIGCLATERTILLGDFNVWRQCDRALDAFAAKACRDPAPRTFPAPCPLLALDRIFVWPKGALLEQHAHRSRAACLASDHLPLVADVAW